MGYAIDAAILSAAGLIPADNDAKQAYQALATGLILKPVRSIKRVMPDRMRKLRAGDEFFLGHWFAKKG